MNDLLWRQSESIRQLEERFLSLPSAPTGLSSSLPFDQGSSSHFYPFPHPFCLPLGPLAPSDCLLFPPFPTCFLLLPIFFIGDNEQLRHGGMRSPAAR